MKLSVWGIIEIVVYVETKMVTKLGWAGSGQLLHILPRHIVYGGLPGEEEPIGNYLPMATCWCPSEGP